MKATARQILLTASLALICTTLVSQETPLYIALPIADGALVMPHDSMDGMKVTQLSAKAKGREFGVRLHNGKNMEVLAFYFLTDKPHQSASNCMADEIIQRTKDVKGQLTEEKLSSSSTTERRRVVLGKRYVTLLQTFSSGGPCGIVEVYAAPQTTLDEAAAAAYLDQVRFLPDFKPTWSEKFIYAETMYRNGMFAAAAPMFKIALEAVPKDDKTWRRVTIDQYGMSLGLSGQVDEARSVFEKARAADPDYPLYDYNLACADAEQGKADSAREHLVQAWKNRENTVEMEPFPDPTTDDSLMKLHGDKQFWQLATQIHNELANKQK